MEIMRNWSDVPQELLGSIAERFTSIEDYFRFGAVCRTWRSVIVDLRRRHFKPKTLPWLMFTEFQEDEEGSHIKDEQGNSVKVVFARPGNSAWVAIELPSTTNDDILHFNNQFYIIDKEGILRSFDITSPNPVGIDIALSPVHINDDCDSFYLVELLGELHMAFSSKALPWLMLPQDDEVEGDRSFFSLSKNKSHTIFGEMEILNPLTLEQVLLPPLYFRNLQRLFLLFKLHSQSRFSNLLWFSPSTTPTKDLFVALVTFSKHEVLAFARPGDKTWTTVEIPHTFSSGILYDDNLHFNDQFYIVDTEGKVRYFDISSPNPVAVAVALPPEDLEAKENMDVETEGRRFYLVELQGDQLHMVVKLFYFETRPLDCDKLENDRPFELHHPHTNLQSLLNWIYAMRNGKRFILWGTMAIFVGMNTSFSLLVSDYPLIQDASLIPSTSLNR
ncbi:hypothetical protein IFM89_003148 [Coptis chinensis]|uniref:F-box domain-containing protein n=1 Tax=Coptis chinensis TaxID=261450 RepID=A0A835IB74_9MAGN|nr:hypothetical protein IFM89_003148 [Coptis chinensis]